MDFVDTIGEDALGSECLELRRIVNGWAKQIKDKIQAWDLRPMPASFGRTATELVRATVERQ